MNRKHLLVAVAIAVAATAKPAQADPGDWFRREVVDPMFRMGEPEYIITPSSKPQYAPLQPIDRRGFSYIDEMGNGVDSDGYYQTPVPVDRAFGVQLRDGIYEAPMRWEGDDPQHGVIRYEVQGGYIIRQRYGFENP
jgi:hypothetical protein